MSSDPQAGEQTGRSTDTSTLRIRRARADDADTLTALCVRAKSHWGYSARQMALWQDQLRVRPETLRDHCCHVAELDGVVAGYSILLEQHGRWVLDDLFVDPSAMRRGVGQALLAQASQCAQSLGARDIEIDADPNAARFYERQGARRVAAIAAPIDGDPGRVRPQLRLALAQPLGVPKR